MEHCAHIVEQLVVAVQICKVSDARLGQPCALINCCSALTEAG